MNDDRRTKAQILDELEKVQTERDQLKSRIPQPAAVVPTAAALAGCIRALDSLPANRRRDLYGTDKPDPGEIANILRHLMSRYDVDLTVRTVEPCTRVHLEDASDAVLLDRIRGRF